jgi:hypothetical protein
VQVIELTLTASFYVHVARVLRALDADLEPATSGGARS